jgi:hypothetical protein
VINEKCRPYLGRRRRLLQRLDLPQQQQQHKRQALAGGARAEQRGAQGRAPVRGGVGKRVHHLDVAVPVDQELTVKVKGLKLGTHAL